MPKKLPMNNRTKLRLLSPKTLAKRRADWLSSIDDFSKTKYVEWKARLEAKRQAEREADWQESREGERKSLPEPIVFRTPARQAYWKRMDKEARAFAPNESSMASASAASTSASLAHRRPSHWETLYGEERKREAKKLKAARKATRKANQTKTGKEGKAKGKTRRRRRKKRKARTKRRRRRKQPIKRRRVKYRRSRRKMKKIK